MSKDPTLLRGPLYQYALDNWLRDSDLKARLRAETAKLPQAMMQISPDQGQVLALLAASIGARRTIEIGTFTGYSALCVAEALPADGSVLACDVNRDWTDIAKRYWKEAGLAGKIKLMLAPALDTTQALLGDAKAGTFDFAFIDADKKNYDAYYENCLLLLRKGGLLCIDNVLWGGAVIDAARTDEDTEAIRALNTKLKDDRRIDLALWPVGDGLTVARKR